MKTLSFGPRMSFVLPASGGLTLGCDTDPTALAGPDLTVSSSIVASSPPPGLATYTLGYEDLATGRDLPPQDGVYDVFPVSNLGTVDNNGFQSFRTGFEFNLSRLPPGGVVVSAQLLLPVYAYEGPRSLELHGYSGDGSVDLADFSRDRLLATWIHDAEIPLRHFSLDVSSLVASMYDAGGRHAGFNVREEPGHTGQGLLVMQIPWWQGRPVLNVDVIASIPVETDIKPGNDDNVIPCENPNATVTVAILTAEDFDATTIDHTTVTFEGASETHRNSTTGEPRRHENDVNDDGDVDLIFHFRVGDTRLDCFSEYGTLSGETYDGVRVEGKDAVRMKTNMSGLATCPFKPVAIFLTGEDPVSIRVHLTATGQNLNWASDDPPRVNWAFKEPGGTVLESGEKDDGWSSRAYGAGFYDLVFQSDLAGTSYPDIQVNLACEYEAPQPERW